MNRVISIEVRGIPAPQGSKRGFVNKKTGKVNMVESSAKLAPWRDAVRGEAQRAMQAAAAAPLEGPVSVSFTFYMPRPASAPKRVLWPVKQPDLDKLVRSTMDGLTAGGAWLDDAQAVTITATKRFADLCNAAGCVIHLVAAEAAAAIAAAPFEVFQQVKISDPEQPRHPEGLAF